MNRFETYFDAFYAYSTTETVQFQKHNGQFENLGFVIMSTRENIRLIARAPLIICIMRRLLDKKTNNNNIFSLIEDS